MSLSESTLSLYSSLTQLPITLLECQLFRLQLSRTDFRSSSQLYTRSLVSLDPSCDAYSLLRWLHEPWLFNWEACASIAPTAPVQLLSLASGRSGTAASYWIHNLNKLSLVFLASLRVSWSCNGGIDRSRWKVPVRTIVTMVDIHRGWVLRTTKPKCFAS